MSKIIVEFQGGHKSEYVHAYGLTFEWSSLEFVPNKDLKSHIENIRHLEVGDDDVYLATFPKCGTHWVWEILVMLKKGNAEYETKPKHSAFLELSSMEKIGSLPSPRVLNCHYPCKLMPIDIIKKGIKIVHVMRNPKDAFVSFYLHVKSFGGEMFKQSFQEFLSTMLGDCGVYLWYPWFKYVKEWERFLKQHPEQILNLYFEDLKVDSVREIKKINSFLNTGRSEDVVRQIAEACEFQNLKKADAEIKVHEDFMKDAGYLYRKGEVGDWKNHFTVAQNERMDEWLDQNLIDTDLQFRFTL